MMRQMAFHISRCSRTALRSGEALVRADTPDAQARVCARGTRSWQRSRGDHPKLTLWARWHATCTVGTHMDFAVSKRHTTGFTGLNMLIFPVAETAPVQG